MTLDNMQIDFEGGINGGGEDVCGEFTISGNLKSDNTFNFEKAYDSYSVQYNGKLEGMALRGNWSLPGQAEEEFEITLGASKWVGSFDQGGESTEMILNMGISSGSVFGVGLDDIGTFVLRGTTDEESFNFVKKYIGQHEVLYFGQCRGDRNKTVRGKWTIPGNCEGNFMLKQA